LAILAVNPTRMELTRLKRRLITARRGYKLLKDKRDELMKQFLDIARENRKLRASVEQALMKVHASFTVAAAVMSPEMLMQALMLPKQSVSVGVDYKNIMSVNVPEFDFKMQKNDPSDIYPYGFSTTSGELDGAVNSLFAALGDMLLLAQREKAVQLLAQEIEKTRRRVNALEYIMIPELEETIRYISMKLDENERGNTTRLMKVKDMMIEEQIRANQAARSY
jgi:V/A-type H+-transporting ATPase subunit D